MNRLKKINELKAELAELTAEVAAFDKLCKDNPAYGIAECLHEAFGRINDDGWYYESWQEMGRSRKEYVGKASNLLKLLNGDIKLAQQIIEVLK